MSLPEKLHHLLHLIILLHYLTTTTTVTATTSDLTTLIYKGCGNQNFQNPTLTSQTLKNLFTTLVTQSTTTTFFNTTSGQTNDQTTITGLYQCRGDLSITDCNTCVKKLPHMIQKLCNKDTIAARVQLTGCYMRYEVVGIFQQVPATELLYKSCGSGQVDDSDHKFDQKLEAALGTIPKGVASNNNVKGYYASEYELVYVLGQCEGGLGGGECANCLKNAAENARSQCRSSVSGRVFLQQCYVSYTYYPNGVPGDSGDGGGGRGGVSGVETGVTEIKEGGGGRNNTQKAVAIVFGGLAAMVLVLALLLVLKSAFKKKKEHHSYGGY